MERVNKRELTKQLDQSHGSFELVLSPLILGLGGWWLDGRLHTGPWFAIAAVLVGLTGAIIKLVTEYRASMATHSAARANGHQPAGGAS